MPWIVFEGKSCETLHSAVQNPSGALTSLQPEMSEMSWAWEKPCVDL